tara:strand:+ start:244 stop:729 length:486 start_codon:yes stop_codon:yes gene_type:complete
MSCLKYIVETFHKPKEPPGPKYIPLQSIICEPLEYNVTKCIFSTHRLNAIKRDKTQDISCITLSKDRILLGDNESLKYDYILNISRISPKIFRINIMGDINKHDGRLVVADGLLSIIIQLADKSSYEFINQLLMYITSYKKYNIFDKSVFGFKTYKLFFKK